jgi:hypothetical protein
MKILITEANLTNFNELITAINNVLDTKNIPQFAGADANKVRDWFLKQYVAAIKNDEIDLKNAITKHTYKSDEPQWMNKPDIMDFKGSLPEDIVDEISHMVDYFSTLEPNDLRKIYKEPYKVINQKVKDWDKELAASSTDTAKEDVAKKRLVSGKDYKIIKEVGNGLKWVKLLTPLSKDVEGDFMGHCVGHVGYEKADIYSLWDSKNRSHVTIEANDKKKTISQIKGKENKEPVEKYIPASIYFVAEAMMQGYKVIGDGENVGMIKHGTDYHFDELETLPEKYRDKSVFRMWVDKIYPTEVFPKQQKAIADLQKRIVVV